MQKLKPDILKFELMLNVLLAQMNQDSHSREKKMTKQGYAIDMDEQPKGVLLQ